MAAIRGTDTFKAIDPNLGQKELTLSKELLYPIEMLKKLLNAKSIALLPYCITCKRQLWWHVDEKAGSSPGRLLFTCHECGREWSLE